MKKIRLIIPVFLLLAIGLGAMGQNSKAEKAALKKELKMYKKMKPIQVRQMKLNYEAKLKDMEALNTELKKSKAREDSVQRLYNAASNKLKMIDKEIAAAREEADMAKQGMIKGYAFRVQLGAFRKFDIKGKLGNDDAMQGENVDGMDKYTVGMFTNFAEAEAFKNDIRRMGMRDAFIVAYKDGVRIPVNEAIAATK